MKECFGNYMEYPICEGHHDCKEVDCYGTTMINKGLCDCPYKGSCHLMRQKLQVEFRQNYNDKLEDCDFFKLLKPEYDSREIDMDKELTANHVAKL